jgi:hypothetical protein
MHQHASTFLLGSFSQSTSIDQRTKLYIQGREHPALKLDVLPTGRLEVPQRVRIEPVFALLELRAKTSLEGDHQRAEVIRRQI